jgi:membrane protease YdiL (CAAX protease family)
MSFIPVDKLADGAAEGIAAEGSGSAEREPENTASRRRRDVVELAAGFGLILLAIWTPLPLQRWADFAALAWVLAATVSSFDGWSAMGLRERGFLRSLWVVGAALVVSGVAVVVGGRLNTLHTPSFPALFIHRYWLYAVWAFLQQFLVLDFFLLRLLRLLTSKTAAIAATAALFALAHMPNPVLTPLTLVWGAIACALFLRYRNLYTLGMAHAIFGICIAVTVPGHVDHNMRVGIGYLMYNSRHHHRHFQRNQIPQTVSTAAWVMAEAPMRRS